MFEIGEIIVDMDNNNRDIYIYALNPNPLLSFAPNF